MPERECAQNSHSILPQLAAVAHVAAVGRFMPPSRAFYRKFNSRPCYAAAHPSAAQGDDRSLDDADACALEQHAATAGLRSEHLGSANCLPLGCGIGSTDDARCACSFAKHKHEWLRSHKKRRQLSDGDS
eukprot:906332-Pleurochrysis_carterae.AAC.1